MQNHWIAMFLALGLGACESSPREASSPTPPGGEQATVNAVLSLGTRGDIGVQTRVGGASWKTLAVGLPLASFRKSVPAVAW